MGVGVGVTMSVSQSVVDEAPEVVSGRVTEKEGDDWMDEEPERVDRPGVEVTMDKVLEAEGSLGVRTKVEKESEELGTPGVLMDEPSVMVVSQGSVVVCVMTTVVGVPSSQIDVVVNTSVITVELGMTIIIGVSSSQSVVVVDSVSSMRVISSSQSSVGTALGVSVTKTVTSTVVVETITEGAEQSMVTISSSSMGTTVARCSSSGTGCLIMVVVLVSLWER